jgi:hypothetical protein
MKQSLILGPLTAVMISAVMASTLPVLASADTATATEEPTPSAADVLVNRDVVNNNDDAVGTIDSVTLNSSGRVDYVIIDVSSWVGSEKLISVPWRDLSVDSDGNVRTTLTKDAVKKSVDYAPKTAIRASKAISGDTMSDIDDLYRARPILFERRPD